MNTAIYLAVFSFVCSLTFSRATDLATEKLILENIMKNADQNTLIRPAGVNDSGPVVVETNIYVRRISAIDEDNMEFKAQLIFRQKWHDERLAYKNKFPKFRTYVNLRNIQSVWYPDGFFSNENEGHFHNILTPNTLMRIYPNGDVLFSIRISLKLSCPMDLKNFPLDNQICSVIYASYGYTTEQLVLLWKQGDPVQITKRLHLKEFELQRFTTDYCTSKTNTGEYSCLKLELMMSRKSNYYGIRMYIPFSMLLIISWIPFWLNSRETIGRFSILASVLITMAIIASSNYSIIPQVTYTMAIGVWNGICWTFLLAAFIESTIVARLSDEEEEGSPNLRNDAKGMNAQDSKRRKWLNKYTHVQKIDVISRIAYPATFVLFNIIYWAAYL